MDDFNHKKERWLAEIPIDKIEKSSIFISSFLKGKVVDVAHLSVHYRLMKGNEVILHSKNADKANETVSLPGFGYSLYYAAPEGVKYDPVKGLGKGYASTPTLKSPQDLKLYIALSDRNLKKPSTTVYDLNLNPSENARFVRTLLEEGTKEGTSHAYNTVCYNCATPVFRSLNTALERPYSTIQKCRIWMRGFVNASPSRSWLPLKALGVIEKSYPSSQFIWK